MKHFVALILMALSPLSLVNAKNCPIVQNDVRICARKNYQNEINEIKMLCKDQIVAFIAQYQTRDCGAKRTVFAQPLGYDITLDVSLRKAVLNLIEDGKLIEWKRQLVKDNEVTALTNAEQTFLELDLEENDTVE